MWITVLVLAGAVIFEPIRVGLVILLLSRRRPLLQLLTFLCGGFAMGVGAGLIVLFVLRAAPVVGHFSVAEVQIASGLVALLVAVALATNVVRRRIARTAPVDATIAGGGVALLEGTAPNGRQQLAERARAFLRGDSLSVAAVSGMGASLPSANYMGSMAAILASHAAPVAQVQALVAFNVVAFTVAELPLIGYLAAPQRTRAFMAALQNWLRSRGHRDIAVLVAAGGCFMLVLGLINLGAR
ncbi:GAP family protein [Mycobacterium paraffinicum]|uniref:Sulfolipid-1 biosynthesis transporter Sap n=1 Tax=Mycobacterium paraffinicum TaxID=53378 RepID=A0ABP8RGL1_9MYCO|nr:GAP family protein [Mycobacterium paraffinicum]MCV7310936.1 GAP family protein [Mycobacterium paraffinicum]